MLKKDSQFLEKSKQAQRVFLFQPAPTGALNFLDSLPQSVPQRCLRGLSGLLCVEAFCAVLFNVAP